MGKTIWMHAVAFVSVPLFAHAAETGKSHVTIDEIPAAARKTIEKESAGATVKEIEKEKEGGRTFYEAEIVKNGRESYIHVSESGKVLKRETKKQEQKAEPTEDED